jgi:hypothetical protein
MRINTESPEEAAEVIYQVLFGQRFSDWYHDGGDFGNHVTGETDMKSKIEIIEQIKSLFKINQ